MRRREQQPDVSLAVAHSFGPRQQLLQRNWHRHRQRRELLDGGIAGRAGQYARTRWRAHWVLFGNRDRVARGADRRALPGRHCRIRQDFPGYGTELTARSFSAYPGYRESDPAGLDVGVVLMSADLGRAPVPVLFSRDARVGETAILAGWGNDQNQVASTLRAGSTTITAVGSTQLQTQYSATASSVCSGDSGGPLLLQENGVWAVAGITSAVTTTACSFGTNYFANVRNTNITSFILDQVPDAARR